MEDRARNGRIGPAGEARPLESGHAALVVAGQTEDGLEVRHGAPSVFDDDSLPPSHAVNQSAQLVLRLGYTGSFHKAIIARIITLFKSARAHGSLRMAISTVLEPAVESPG